MPMPKTTKTYRLRSFDKDLGGLVLDDVPLPDALGETQVIATGTYPAPVAFPSGLVPLSDGAGEVLATGSRVETCKPGDRVVTHLCAEWTHGEIGNQMQQTALGGGKDGVFAQHVVLDQGNLLPIPSHMSYEEASTLPVAALTAYHCLFGFASTLQPGQAILVEGTGGVSLAALQLALAAGARPIVISSSDDKLQRCKQMGVAQSDLINYRTNPMWHDEVRRLTQGKGVDHTIEIGGRDTLVKATLATRPYGSVWVVGYMDDYKTPSSSTSELPDMAKAVLYSQAEVKGVMCGSYQLFQQFLAAHAVAHQRVESGLAKTNWLQPVVDQVFDFNDAKQAFETLRSGSFFGKIVVRVQQ
ncbi:related to alcohol dehydrogenase [Pseudozyma flocculosa]|uniref:Related to alcohol dehydrogenase n=1 Tax=Pseudozyma flocculosa TaxID=84751 RepID=A0A5C3F5M4_9BASI|nr:related to alcohol dehydrogenase [Pseudozyma flocculosa]